MINGSEIKNKDGTKSLHIYVQEDNYTATVSITSNEDQLIVANIEVDLEDLHDDMELLYSGGK